MSTKSIIIGNWKMNKNLTDVMEYISLLKQHLSELNLKRVDIAIAPPSLYLALFTDAGIEAASQNIYWESFGAYTGETSAPMLQSLGIKYVLIGHSERRQYFAESDAHVNLKVKAALDNALVPVICLGESISSRKADETEKVVRNQLEAALKDIELQENQQLIVAYEPIWAIGSGLAASSQDAQQVACLLREILLQRFGASLASSFRILYGGSVTDDNITEYINEADIDGALVGGASLDADKFAKLISIVDRYGDL